MKEAQERARLYVYMYKRDCYFAGLTEIYRYRQSKNSKIELYVPYVRSRTVLHVASL